MSTPTCSQCAKALPAWPADPSHPDLCATCVGAAAGASIGTSSMAGPPPPPPLAGPPTPLPPLGPPALGATVPSPNVPVAPPFAGPAGFLPVVTRTRPFEALLVGLAAAGLAGIAWWAAAVALNNRQFVYVAILVGAIVGQGVLIGARKGGAVPAVIAGVVALVALVVAEYFIQRSLAIDALGSRADIPLWQGFGTAVDIVREAIDAEPITPVLWGVAAVVAMVSAGSSSRRPVV